MLKNVEEEEECQTVNVPQDLEFVASLGKTFSQKVSALNNYVLVFQCI